VLATRNDEGFTGTGARGVCANLTGCNQIACENSWQHVVPHAHAQQAVGARRHAASREDVAVIERSCHAPQSHCDGGSRVGCSHAFGPARRKRSRALRRRIRSEPMPDRHHGICRGILHKVLHTSGPGHRGGDFVHGLDDHGLVHSGPICRKLPEASAIGPYVDRICPIIEEERCNRVSLASIRQGAPSCATIC
jgi:hypothetical protein